MFLVLFIQLIKQFWQEFKILLKRVLSKSAEVIPQQIIDLYEWFTDMSALIDKHFLQGEIISINGSVFPGKKCCSKD